MRFFKNHLRTLIICLLIATVFAVAIYYFSFSNKNEAFFDIKKEFNVKPKNYIQLLFIGDIMLDRGIRYYAQKNGGKDFIFEKISSTLLESDLVIANLEGPITNNKSVSLGTIPGSENNYFFTFEPSWANVLYKNNIKAVNLGNNHILNFGQNGLESTEKYLGYANIKYFNSPSGSRSVNLLINGIKVALVGFNEFSQQNESESQNTINEIKRVKEQSDIIIVFSHWGVEYSSTVDETIKNVAHSFIDSGADLVIGCHPHVVQPSEVYNGKRIYYSLGNFIFDQHFNKDVRKGMGVVVSIDKNTKEMNFDEKRFYLQGNGKTILEE